MRALNIVFAGTPAFTLPSLNALNASQHHLKAVYTQPSRPAGRGRATQDSAVKTWADAHGVPVYQPLHFKDKESIDALAALSPDVMVVIAYGLILPTTVLSLPTFGCINVHASLLPRWRGASPIQQAILHGDARTGVTLMQMDAGMDTGAMLMQVSCDIGLNDTTTTLHDRLAELAVAPLLATLDALSQGHACATPQDHALVTYAPKIKKEEALIDWKKSAVEIHQQIRAYNPWPIAYTHADTEVIRVYQASLLEHASTQTHGTVLALDKEGMLVSTGAGALLIEMIQFAGGRAMKVSDWLNSARKQVSVGMVFK